MGRPRKSYIVVFEHETPGRKTATGMLVDEDDNPLRFEHPDEARRAVRGMPWEYAWPWWIVDLSDGGRVLYGTA